MKATLGAGEAGRQGGSERRRLASVGGGEPSAWRGGGPQRARVRGRRRAATVAQRSAAARGAAPARAARGRRHFGPPIPKPAHRAPARPPGAGAAGAIARRGHPASPHPRRAHFFAFFSSAMRPDTDFWATAAAARTVSARRGAAAPVPKAPARLRSACCMAAPAARWANSKGGAGGAGGALLLLPLCCRSDG